MSKTLKETRKDMFFVDPRNIETIPDMNIRTEYGNIRELADNIKVNGVKQPLRGHYKDGKYIVTDGHRRLKACMMLVEDKEEIRVPFIVEPKNYSEQQRVIDMVLCNDGKKLTPLEEAEAVNRLINMGLTEKEVSAKIMRTVGYVKNLRHLSTAPAKIKNMIQKNLVSGTLAINVLRQTKNPEEAIILLEKTLEAANSNLLFGGKRATEKSVKKAHNKVNSFSELRKFFKIAEKEKYKLNDSKTEMIGVLRKLVDGKLKMNEIKTILIS